MTISIEAGRDAKREVLETLAELSTTLDECQRDARRDAKRKVLEALGEFSTALAECEKILTTPDAPTEQVAFALSLMSAGVTEVARRIQAGL